MREIKFRAWDKKNKQMVNVIRLDWTRDGGSIFYLGYQKPNTMKEDAFKKFKLMQYTGLKDKNGIEIYEGDVVKGWLPNSEKDIDFEKMEIKYSGDSFSLYRVKIRDLDINEALYFGDLESCTLNKSIEVIGNIYENPELLK